MASQVGAALPQVDALRHLHSYGVRFRRGQLVMVAGQSGGGKSTFALWLALTMGVRTLYISADMSQHTALTRTAACVTGESVTSIAAAVDPESPAYKPEAVDYYCDSVADVPVTWAFDPGPSLKSINAEIDAYVEVWNAFPDLIVIDNLMDVDVGDETLGGQQYIMRELHVLSRVTSAMVLVLHHCRENPAGDKRYDSSNPPAKWEIKNKLSEKPEIILTVAIDQSTQTYKVAPVKVRDGKCDDSGTTFFRLRADLERARFHLYQVFGGSDGAVGA